MKPCRSGLLSLPRERSTPVKASQAGCAPQLPNAAAMSHKDWLRRRRRSTRLLLEPRSTNNPSRAQSPKHLRREGSELGKLRNAENLLLHGASCKEPWACQMKNVRLSKLKLRFQNLLPKEQCQKRQE